MPCLWVVTDADSLVVAINSIPAGESVRMKLLRHDEEIERTVELAKLRVNGPVIATNRPSPASRRTGWCCRGDDSRPA